MLFVCMAKNKKPKKHRKWLWARATWAAAIQRLWRQISQAFTLSSQGTAAETEKRERRSRGIQCQEVRCLCCRFKEADLTVLFKRSLLFYPWRSWRLIKFLAFRFIFHTHKKKCSKSGAKHKTELTTWVTFEQHQCWCLCWWIEAANISLLFPINNVFELYLTFNSCISLTVFYYCAWSIKRKVHQ